VAYGGGWGRLGKQRNLGAVPDYISAVLMAGA
jgi:hypothetical protein